MIDLAQPDKIALVLVDLQRDFMHPDGAYARGGASAAAIAELPARLKPVADAVRAKGGWIVSTHFTLVPGKGGEPFISPHLKALRPFLRKGDFAPGSWGHALVDDLQPADLCGGKGGVLGLLHEPSRVGAAQGRHRDAGVLRHRHQWRRRLDVARCACPRLPCRSCSRTAALPFRTRFIEPASKRFVRSPRSPPAPTSSRRCRLLADERRTGSFLRSAERGAHARDWRRGLRTCRGVDGEADRHRGARAGA